MIAIAIFSFVLLNLTFVFDAVYQTLLRTIFIRFIFGSLEPDSHVYWLPLMFHLSSVVVISLISWLIFKSKLKTFYKAVYTTAPTAVILVTLGMFLSNRPILSYALGGLLTAGIVYYLYRTKQSWLYSYSIILVAIILLIYALMGGDI